MEVLFMLVVPARRAAILVRPSQSPHPLHNLLYTNPGRAGMQDGLTEQKVAQSVLPMPSVDTHHWANS